MATKKDQTETAPSEKDAAPADVQAKAADTKGKRRQRTIEERIAELQAQKALQTQRKKTRLEKALAEAEAQEVTAKERYDNVTARVKDLKAQLAELTSEDGSDSDN